MKTIQSSDIFVFGYFGFVTNQLDGQTIKTRMVHHLFEEKLSGPIPMYDTELLKNNKLSLLISLWYLIRAKHVIYLPAQNNLERFFPILYYISKLFHFKIHYFVVGGWLPEFILKHPTIETKLKKIFCIYLETYDMKDKLMNNFKFRNVIWFPNFRIDYHAQRTIKHTEKLRLVFLSRIALEKGIDTIFGYLDSVMSTPICNQISIDFYGPVDSIVENWFFSQVAKHQNSHYGGTIAAEKVQSVLCNYDLMLFPTRYAGEGCPGAIIEAYMASVPVLASNWRYNMEFVAEGKTGYLFTPNNINQISTIIASLVNNRALVDELGKNAKVYSNTFSSSKVWELIKLN
jgi:glycosyltransferase involved in cell wall biosynthesis